MGALGASPSAAGDAFQGYARARKVHEAMELLAQMEEAELQVATFHYNLALRASAGKWRLACNLLERMWHRRAVDAISYSSCIKACTFPDGWRLVLQLLDSLQAFLGPQTITYNTGLSSLLKGSAWQACLQLLAVLCLQRQPLPDIVAFTVGIQACHEGDKWDGALWLLESMLHFDIQPDVMSLNLAIHACARHWKCALRLLSGASPMGLQVNLISFHSLLGPQLQWRATLAVLGQLGSLGLEPSSAPLQLQQLFRVLNLGLTAECAV